MLPNPEFRPILLSPTETRIKGDIPPGKLNLQVGLPQLVGVGSCATSTLSQRVHVGIWLIPGP